LFLEEFFIDKIIIQNKDKDIIVKKKFNPVGYIEFILRTLYPAKLFEYAFGHGELDLENIHLERLKEFSNTNIYSKLDELYDTFLPFWIKDSRNNNILEREFFEKIRDNIFHYSSIVDSKNYVEKYYMHSYKFFVLLSKLPELPEVNYIEKKKTEIEKLAKDYLFEFKNSGIGIITSLKSINNLVENMMMLKLDSSGYNKCKEQHKLNYIYNYLAYADSIFINNLIVYFLESYNVSNISMQYVIPKIDTILISNNAFLDNIKVLFESDDTHCDNGICDFFYLCIFLSQIENKYVYEDSVVKFFNSKYKVLYKVKEDYTEKIYKVKENYTKEICEKNKEYLKCIIKDAIYDKQIAVFDIRDKAKYEYDSLAYSIVEHLEKEHKELFEQIMQEIEDAIEDR
jgi:hypothetical protein